VATAVSPAARARVRRPAAAGSTLGALGATRVSDAGGMSRWRERLFVAIWRNAADPVGYFRLPERRAVTLGLQVSL
jgi:K+ transporter